MVLSLQSLGDTTSDPQEFGSRPFRNGCECKKLKLCNLRRSKNNWHHLHSFHVQIISDWCLFKGGRASRSPQFQAGDQRDRGAAAGRNQLVAVAGDLLYLAGCFRFTDDEIHENIEISKAKPC